MLTTFSGHARHRVRNCNSAVFVTTMRTMLEVAIIPVLDDNYSWLLHDAASGETAAIDPALAEPVLATAAARGWHITQIWNTHWHPDHVGGNEAIKAHVDCRVSGPAMEADRIPGLDRTLADGDTVTIGSIAAEILHMPGHTDGHIVYYLPTEQILFAGDILFPMGCGRLFEGNATEMYSNMRRLARLPAETLVFSAHEYAQSNGRFALAVEPDNIALRTRMESVARLRELGMPTVPTTIALEIATNPFIRAKNVAEFAERRAAKDAFRG